MVRGAQSSDSMISVLQLPAIDYATGLRLQQKLVELRKDGVIGDVLLLLEHAPVITLGRNAKATNVLASSEHLAERGVEIFDCDRGGDVTFHGPGQIVGYPIFDLRGFARGAADASSLRKTLGAVDFVRRLEEVLIRTCADFAIPTKRVSGLTGVWTDPCSLSFRAEENDSQNRSLESRNLLPADAATSLVGTAALRQAQGRLPAVERSEAGRLGNAAEAKLAAIGVHISRSVTSHGFALNVNTDLSFFDLIIPCGITAKAVTSMRKELGKPLDLNAVAESLSRNFGTVFSSQMLWVDTLDALLGRKVGVPMQVPAELRKLHQIDDTSWA